MHTKNPVGWFEIYVNDMDRAKTFYQNAFQTEFERIEGDKDFGIEMWGFTSDMKDYGATGALVKMEGMPATPGSTLVYFSCADCAVEEKRFAEFGGSIEKPKFSIGQYGFISIVKDSEGNVVGLHSEA